MISNLIDIFGISEISSYSDLILVFLACVVILEIVITFFQLLSSLFRK